VIGRPSASVTTTVSAALWPAVPAAKLFGTPKLITIVAGMLSGDRCRIRLTGDGRERDGAGMSALPVPFEPSYDQRVIIELTGRRRRAAHGTSAVAAAGTDVVVTDVGVRPGRRIGDGDRDRCGGPRNELGCAPARTDAGVWAGMTIVNCGVT